MAQMMPPVFPFPDDPERRAESQVFTQFSSLEDKWVVVYSLAWHGERKGRTGDGEGDFILLHPNYGFFVAEVKGGQRVFLQDGQWFSVRHGDGKVVNIKDPFEQALSTSKALDKWLKEHHNGPRLPPFGHFVVFPGHVQNGDISPVGRRELIVDKTDLAAPLTALRRLSDHWNRKTSLKDEDIQRVVKLLRPDIEFSLDKRVYLEHAQRGMEELTEHQRIVYEAVRRQNRVLVQGSAGTGKTVLAVDAAKYHADSGKRTLLLCFNRPLGEKLQSNLSNLSNLVVGSFHSFAKREVETASLPYEDFEDIPYLLMDAASMNRTSFEALVIDEAQDFKADWWEALIALCKDITTATVHVFRDINQDIYEGEPFPTLETFQPVDLMLNCRNTLPIALNVHRLGNIDTKARSVDGPMPEFLTIDSRSKAESKIKEITDRWINEIGVAPSDITILTDTADLADNWYETGVIGSTSNDGLTGRLQVETIHRFKGLESDAVICVFDPEANTPHDKDALSRLGYIGFSRAKTLLAVLANTETLKLLQG